MRRPVLLFLLVFLSVTFANAQQASKAMLEISIADYETGQKIPGAMLVIAKENKGADSTYFSDTSGIYPKILINLYEKCDLVFSLEGYMEKKLVIDLKKMPNDVNYKGVEFTITMTLVKTKLAEQCLGKEMHEIESQVFSTLTYQPETDAFNWDQEKPSRFNRMMKECLDRKGKQ